MTAGRRLKVALASNMYAYSGNWDKLDALSRFVDLVVITPDRWGVPELGQVLRVPQSAGDAGWRHHRLPTYVWRKGNPFRHFYHPAALSRVLAAERPDIVHVEQEPESINLLQFSLLRQRAPYRLVFVAWEDLNPLRLGWGFRKVNYAAADGGIFGNRAAMERARRLGFRKEMEVIPQYGFEVTYKGQPRPADGRYIVGYAGRLVPEKGVLTLVEATRLMPDTTVLIAGEGPLAETLQAEPHVKLLGWTPRNEMESFYTQLDTLVLPSLTLRNKSAEQFGRVLVEAMAAGVPVVGSTAGAISDTIGEAGLVFPEGDAEALRKGLDSIRLNANGREELRELGLRRVQERYSNEVLMGRTVQFYREVLAERSAGERGRHVS